MNKRIILVSGGIDSTLAYEYYRLMSDNFLNIPVFFDYGQPYLKKEEKAVKQLFGNELKKITFQNNIEGNTQNPFIPARNLTLASMVTTIFNPDEIVIAGLRDDDVVDKNPQAFKDMSEILTKFSKKKITVTSPFWNFSKGEIIENYLKNGGDREYLKMAVSCYDGVGDTHCNDCPACFRRYVALKSNDIDVETPTKRIIESYVKKLWQYDEDRRARTFIAIRDLFKDFISYDIDGVLTNEIDGHDYEFNRTPRIEYINKCNADFDDGNLIVLFTSRMNSDREVTENWLSKHNVKYHALITGKLPFRKLYDDRAITVFPVK